MSKEIYISSTPHETRLAIVEKDELTEIYYERENEYTLAGSIYNGRVTRVLPGMQSSFVDIGLERDAFLYITDFMEEAAEFEGGGDTAAPKEARAPREPRREAQPRIEGHAGGEGQPHEGQNREGQNREGRGEGRRSRGRGRRDGRNGGRNREGQPVTASREFGTTGEFVAAPVEDEIFAPISISHEIEELGQGAPGADGVRRWRGRRGRRRGRGGNLALGTVPFEGESVDSVVVETGAPFEDAPLHEAKVVSEVAPQPTQGQQEPRGEGRRGGRNRRGGRDKRGGSPRERFEARAANAEGNVVPVALEAVERVERPERSERPQREGRSDRNDRGGRRDRPRREERTVDVSAVAAPAVAESAPANTVEPFILPGESLSKYRRDDNKADSEPVAKPVGVLVTAKPSNEAPVITGWDGGAVLPGETIRRREPVSEVRTESRGEGRREERGGERGRDRRRGRDSQRERVDSASHGESSAGRQEFKRQEFAPTKLDPAEAVLPAVTSQHDVSEREYEPAYPTPQDAPDDVLPEQDVIEVEMLEEEFDEETVEIPEPELHEETTEYEPGEEASASYRVDPVAPQEFRQSSQVEETEEHVEEHEFTSVQPTGEMISDAVAETASDGAPIEQEQAVQSVHLDELAKEVVPFEQSKGFAPGDGQLEEELIEDEAGENEGEIPSVHARMLHDDSEEHETVEHAAELGRMLRDMSIDELTHVEPVELDEEGDDFEVEEDFEEDELESTDEEAEISGSDVSEIEEDEFAEAESPAYDENGEEIVKEKAVAQDDRAPREGGRRGRRDGRRGGRNRDRNGSSERSTSERSTIEQSAVEVTSSEPSSEGVRERSNESSRSGHRDRRGMAGSRSGGRDRSRSVQATNMPSISDLLKPGQEVLVQIAKEPIAKKGARITSHIALPGRFLVFMPTVSHTGVSRKIESDAERRRLKEILLSERGDASGGFIVRTAAAGASEEDLRSDLRFLLNLWADIKARSESSKSPALIYHDLNLIERILRDQVTDNFSAIWCDTEAEYERVLRFLQRFQPSLVRRVKLYEKETPLFEQFGINPQIDNALRAKVWLKSGGSIVINQTEALVAIDINTGKYVGKTTKLEDTILKTNLDAIPEIVRQMRLRDLGGIIIIDFIDMDERKNRNKVMAALEEELKKDRAPSKVLPFNDFGLVAITRKRVKQSLERTLSSTCNVCQGTGMTKSPVTVCNDLYIDMKKMHKTFEKSDILVRVHPEVVKQLKTNGGKWLTEMEAMSGKTILLKSDPSLHPEQYDIH
jgi:ribonuclease E